MAAEAGSPFFRLGYNSLGAFATINHLHFQVWHSYFYDWLINNDVIYLIGLFLVDAKV